MKNISKFTDIFSRIHFAYFQYEYVKQYHPEWLELLENVIKSNTGVKSIIWNRVKSDVYVSKLAKEQIGFMNLLVRYPKLECKAIIENGIINFNFYLLWKLKDQKKLDYFNIGNVTYNIEKAKFGKFNVFLKITK